MQHLLESSEEKRPFSTISLLKASINVCNATNYLKQRRMKPLGPIGKARCPGLPWEPTAFVPHSKHIWPPGLMTPGRCAVLLVGQKCQYFQKHFVRGDRTRTRLLRASIINSSDGCERQLPCCGSSLPCTPCERRCCPWLHRSIASGAGEYI